ncbi:hypothetical protein [Streptomyces sp. NPDC086989]|uniref:hypothetical protein n=1 Tax=Streptomyces sp. NPDC086989 TaxID=3365764 RepID=UPI003828920A
MAAIVQPDTLLGLAGLQQSFTALPDSTTCASGSFYDPRMDAFPWQGQCWSYPPDHLRNVTPVTSANARWRMTPVRQAPAAFRGPSGITRTFLLERAASSNALLHQQLLGPWTAPELRKNLDIVAVDDVTGEPDGLQPGDLARAIIAYNTP